MFWGILMKKRIITLICFLLFCIQTGSFSKVLAGSESSVSSSSSIVINGQQEPLYPAQKAGKAEADGTRAPKENLQTNETSGEPPINNRRVAPGVSSQQGGSGDIQSPNNRIQRSVPPNFATRSVPSTPIYRFYSPRTQEHFFTFNAAERDQLLHRGWGSYEGISWYAPVSGDDIYRLYNPVTDDHFYTRNWSEYYTLSTHREWIAEAVAFYSDTSQTVPVYRLYNPSLKTGSHHYTTSTHEVDVLTSQRGWHYEGVGWYATSLTGQSDNDYNFIGVKNYNQYALGAPSGCEGASLLQALQYKGALTNWSLRQFLNTIPKSSNGDPNNGFVGSPFTENSWTYSAIYPAPLTSWGQQFGNVQNISGSSVDNLLNEVKNNNPVVTWVTINFQPVRWGRWPFGIAVNNNHAVTLDGYNRSSNQVHVSDPISGSYWLSKTTFESIYNARQYAVVAR